MLYHLMILFEFVQIIALGPKESQLQGLPGHGQFPIDTFYKKPKENSGEQSRATWPSCCAAEVFNQV